MPERERERASKAWESCVKCWFGRRPSWAGAGGERPVQVEGRGSSSSCLALSLIFTNVETTHTYYFCCHFQHFSHELTQWGAGQGRPGQILLIPTIPGTVFIMWLICIACQMLNKQITTISTLYCRFLLVIFSFILALIFIEFNVLQHLPHVAVAFTRHELAQKFKDNSILYAVQRKGN